MKITTILPVSRTQYLDRVLESLNNQTYKPDNLIVIFDGYDNNFLEVRNKIVEQPYDNVLCVPSNNNNVAFTIAERRQHITNVHNQMREIIGDCDWIFSIEDDGVLPPDALEKLVTNMNTLKLKKKKIGMITGVELGRWGFPYVGAWTVDDIDNVKEITSLQSKTDTNDVDNIDACGLYCALIDANAYKAHQFYTNNGLGPDVNLGIYLRQQGLENFINWSIHITHLTFDNGQELEIVANSLSRRICLQLLSGSTWKH